MHSMTKFFPARLNLVPVFNISVAYFWTQCKRLVCCSLMVVMPVRRINPKKLLR